MAKNPIDLIDAPLLKLVSTKQPAELQQWVEPIKSACNKWKINNVRRVAAFIAQQAHEGGFNVKNSRENMRYSAKRMAEVWPGRYAVDRNAKVKQPNAKAIALADTPGINDETMRINGGVIGLEDRKTKFDALIAELLKRGA